ncbi:MAG: DEAD/DEAH box helicase [Eubacteriales bacterium]|nr:DEAD/DEAH box helicase [Eubacteriales bacterium]
MHKITREVIRQMATSDTVYYRGMRYYAAHAVSKVTWNEASGQYRGVVQGGNPYTVTIDFGEDGELQYRCNCPAKVNQHGACKHVVATLLFISDYQQRESMRENQQEGDQTAYEIIEYFRKREYQGLTPTYYHLELRITVNERMRAQGSKAFLRLYAGSGRMYKISNTKKFISDYTAGNVISLGKEFRFIPGECAFEPVSKQVMDYLVEIYEIQETLGKTYYSNLFNRQELVLSQNMLHKLLQLAEGLHIQMTFCGEDMGVTEIVCGNPDISLEIDMDQQKLILKEKTEDRLTAICEDGTILGFDHSLYLPDAEFIANLLPFYTAIFGNESRQVEFRGDNMGDFIEKVLPVIKKSMQITVPEEIRNHYIVEPIEPKLYLDMVVQRHRPVITASLRFCYGDYEVNPLEEIKAGAYIVVRDREEEERLIHLLYDMHFTVNGTVFQLTREEDIFQMMTEHLPELTEQFIVFYSKDYKSIAVRKMGSLQAGIRFNTDINLLEMDLGYTQIPKAELEDFFRAIRLKRKYYRLKSGAFIDLTKQERNIDMLRQMLDVAESTENGTLQFKQNTAIYLEELLPRSNRIQKEESYQKLIQDLRYPEKTQWEIPAMMANILRPYQKVGYQWLKTLAKYGMGGILADDMGLGKTIQTIAYICSNPKTQTLIVCPTSLAYNWQEEFEKFAPHIRTCIVTGNPGERHQRLTQNRDEYDVWITTYPLIRKDVESYREISFDAMFIDEAQFIKNPASLGAKAVKSVKAAHRFALTGTPIENALSELWSIFDFVMPGFFPSYHRFADQYERPILRGNNDKRMQELRKRIQPFILRRMKKDVLKELPDKIETRRTAQMTAKQKKIYRSYLSRIQAEIRDKDSFADGQDRLQVLAALTRLRQICCHPGTFVENYQGGSGKLELLMEQLPDLLAAGHHVIIFSQFTSMLSLIAAELRNQQIAFYYLAGSTSPEERKREVKSFNQGEVNVFLVSLKAGGTGLNLTGADTVIHFDPWWNPAVEDQATDRAYRIGQKRKVQVIKYVMKDSIEEKIYELQKRKKNLSDRVIQSGEMFVNQLTSEELFALLRPDLEEEV